MNPFKFRTFFILPFLFTAVILFASFTAMANDAKNHCASFQGGKEKVSTFVPQTSCTVFNLSQAQENDLNMVKVKPRMARFKGVYEAVFIVLAAEKIKDPGKRFDKYQVRDLVADHLNIS